MKTTRRTVIKGAIGALGGALVAGEIGLDGGDAQAGGAPAAQSGPEEGAPTSGPVTSSRPLTNPESPWYMGSELLITVTGNQGKPIPFAFKQSLLAKAASIAKLTSLVPVREQVVVPTFPSPPLTTIRASFTPAGASVNAAVNSFYNAIHATIPDRRLSLNGLTITSVMPNWITSSAQAWHFGPGSVAEAARDDAYPFQGVPTPPLATNCGRKQGVIVAVLDAAPETRAPLEAAIAAYKQSGKKVVVPLTALNGSITQWIDFVGTGAPVAPPLASHATRDHGIFVASIINGVAPEAQIHMLRVLNDSGGGQTHDILRALNYCLGLARSDQYRGYRLVVNMSLYLLIPPDDAPDGFALNHFWTLPTTGPAPFDSLDLAVKQAIQDLWEAGAVVIAAGGNDAMGYAKLMELKQGPATLTKHIPPIHTDLRRPADYDNVLGVVATNWQGKLAMYSNTDTDKPRQPQVIATWGGESTGQMPDLWVPGMPNTRPRDGVVGIFLGPTWNRMAMPPQYNLPSASGLAYWSGTSFATPIISGIAAKVLLANPCLTPPGVVKQIFALAKPAKDARIGHPYIDIRQ